MAKLGLKICRILINPQKFSQYFKFLPKRWNYAKPGHTVTNPFSAALAGQQKKTFLATFDLSAKEGGKQRGFFYFQPPKSYKINLNFFLLSSSCFYFCRHLTFERSLLNDLHNGSAHLPSVKLKILSNKLSEKLEPWFSLRSKASKNDC